MWVGWRSRTNVKHPPSVKHPYPRSVVLLLELPCHVVQASIPRLDGVRDEVDLVWAVEAGREVDGWDGEEEPRGAGVVGLDLGGEGEETIPFGLVEV